MSNTTQIFIAIDYSILMSEKYFYLRKDKSILQKHFPHPADVTGSMYFVKYFSNYVFPRFLKYTYKNLKEIGIIKAASKLIIFVNL